MKQKPNLFKPLSKTVEIFGKGDFFVLSTSFCGFVDFFTFVYCCKSVLLTNWKILAILMIIVNYNFTFYIGGCIMGRENKKKAVAALHKEQILIASSQLFSEKGFVLTTIEDITKAAKYSRRTIYTYYKSKEDILHHIIAQGLSVLKQDIATALQNNTDFFDAYFAVCHAMKKYQKECPHSLEQITKTKSSNIDLYYVSPAIRQILALETEINSMLAGFIEEGKKQNIIRQEIMTMQTVYVLWSSISSLLSLLQTKGPSISKKFFISQEEFLEYGLKQIINSILVTHI